MSPSHVSGTLPTTDLTLADNSNVCGALGSCQILNLFLSSACSPTGDTGSLVSYQGDSLALTLGLYLLTTLSCLLSLRASVHLVTINNSYWTTSKFETLALQKALLRKVHKCHSQGQNIFWDRKQSLTNLKQTVLYKTYSLTVTELKQISGKNKYSVKSPKVKVGTIREMRKYSELKYNKSTTHKNSQDS